MATMLPTRPGLGTVMGQGLGAGAQNLGSGISSGLEALANLKMQQLQQQQAFERAKPGYEAVGLSPKLFWTPPAFQSAYARPLAEAQAEEVWRRQHGLGEQTPAAGLPQGLPSVTEDVGAAELAQALTSAPKKTIERYTPLLAIKKEEEKLLNQRAMDYESKTRPVVESANRFMMAANNLKQFVKKHPEMFGPVEGRTPTWATTDSETSSLREQRDALINEVVALSLPLEGSIGRGSNLMIQLKKGAKPSASMNPKEFLSTLQSLENIYSGPMKEYEDYIKMMKGGKPPKDFLSKLAERSMRRYESAGAKVLMGTPENRDELLNELPNPASIPKGAQAVDEDTGQVLINNGTEWVVQGEKNAL